MRMWWTRRARAPWRQAGPKRTVVTLAGWRIWAPRTCCTRSMPSNPRPSSYGNWCDIGLCGCGIKRESRTVFTTNRHESNDIVRIAPCLRREDCTGWKSKSSRTLRAIGRETSYTFRVRPSRIGASDRATAYCQDERASCNTIAVGARQWGP